MRTHERASASDPIGQRVGPLEHGAHLLFMVSQRDALPKDLRHDDQPTERSNGKFGTQYILCGEDQLDRLPPRIREAADHPEADDIAFVNAIIDLLIDEYGVDANRVCSAGFSNGGGFSGRVGLELSDRIAAFAMASGQVNVESIATRPISAMMHLGAEETGFPVDESVWDVTEYREAIETALGGLQLDTVYTYDERVIAGVKISRLTFASSAVGAANSFQALMIDSLPHVYPNGRNHPIRMAEIHWSFFSTHSLAEERAAQASSP